VAFTPNSLNLVVKHADGSFHFLSSKSAAEERVLPGPFNFSHIQFDPAGKTFCTLDGRQALIYDATDGTLLNALDHPGVVAVVAWHPDGQRLATACGNAIHFWDA